MARSEFGTGGTASTQQQQAANTKGAARRKSWWGGGSQQRDAASSVDESSRTDSNGLDESTSSRLSIMAGGLFGRNRNRRASQESQEGEAAEEPRLNGGYVIKHSRYEDVSVNTSQVTFSAGNNTTPSSSSRQRTQQRRAPSRARLDRQQSSRSFLESNGVVFPSSFDDVVNKGCGDLKRNLRRSVKTLTLEEREEMRMELAMGAGGDVDGVEW